MGRTLKKVLATAVALGAVTLVQADEPAATPQRPSLGTSVWTVPRGLFELEAGAGFSEGAGALPLFGKYGLTDALELGAGIDALRWVDGPGEGETSVGDLLLGARWRPTGEAARVQLALSGLAKLPTADDAAGSGEVDLTVSGIATVPFDNGCGLDVNLVWSALGQSGGGTLGQGQAIVSLGIPLRSRWSTFVEAAYQRTAGQSDGGFFDAGLAYAASPRAVFDIAGGVGWSEGYPDWSVTTGWTVLFSRP
jgi:hypothetical protein